MVSYLQESCNLYLHSSPPLSQHLPLLGVPCPGSNFTSAREEYRVSAVTTNNVPGEDKKLDTGNGWLNPFTTDRSSELDLELVDANGSAEVRCETFRFLAADGAGLSAEWWAR